MFSAIDLKEILPQLSSVEITAILSVIKENG